MELSIQITIFLIGFFSGAGILAFLYFMINFRKKNKLHDNHDLDSLKTNIQSIQLL